MDFCNVIDTIDMCCTTEQHYTVYLLAIGAEIKKIKNKIEQIPVEVYSNRQKHILYKYLDTVRQIYTCLFEGKEMGMSFVVRHSLAYYRELNALFVL